MVDIEPVTVGHNCLVPLEDQREPVRSRETPGQFLPPGLNRWHIEAGQTREFARVRRQNQRRRVRSQAVAVFLDGIKSVGVKN